MFFVVLFSAPSYLDPRPPDPARYPQITDADIRETGQKLTYFKIGAEIDEKNANKSIRTTMRLKWTFWDILGQFGRLYDELWRI